MAEHITTSPDRIADVWGERTPHARDTEWPDRVDQFLTVDESAVERWVQSACVLCSNGCGMDVAVAGGKMVGVRGRAVDRVNHGRLGPNGLYGWQANQSTDRLTRPLVRVDGELRESDWDTAMSMSSSGRSRSSRNTRGWRWPSTPAVSCSPRSTTR